MADDRLSLFADSGNFYVYLYRDPRPGKNLAPIYVGKGAAHHYRANIHWNRGSHNRILNRKLNKIKQLGLVPVIDIVWRFENEADAFNLERELIKLYGRIHIKTGTLCNLTDGGEGATGTIYTEEQKERYRQAALNRPKRGPPSKETIEKRRAKTKGRPRPPEHMAAAHAARRGFVASKETREKISKARQGQVFTAETRVKLSERAKAQWVRRKAARLDKKIT
jgi:hypothetical protein